MTANPFRLPVQGLGILLTALTTPAHPLNAQALIPDTRIQVRQCPPQGSPGVCVTTQGTFLSMDGDNLSLRDSSGVQSSVAWTPATRVRVSHGKRGLLAQGAAVGLIVGALAGVSAGDSCGGDSERCGFEVPVMAGMGLAVGSLIGIVVRTDRWVTVERPGAPSELSFVSISLRPPTRSTPAGIGLRYKF